MYLYLLLMILALPGQGVADRGGTPPKGCGKAAFAERAARELGRLPDVGILGRGPLSEALDDTDVIHYDLDIEIDPAAKRIDGSNAMIVESRINGLGTFQVRLADTFTISSITVNGTAVQWTRIDSATLEVTLDRVYNTGERFTLTVVYGGVPVGGGFGSIEFTTQGGSPAVWTLSEPWYAYTWWPEKEDNTDKATADLKFTVPDTLVVASNGTLQGVTYLPGNRARYEWATAYPTATYLYCFAATNYHVYTDTFNYLGGSMPVEMYIFPSSDTQSNRDAWWMMIDMLGTFSDLYGLYPFTNEKYGMAQFGWGGGMEHQTITMQSGFWEYITAHELSHQWWGDMITCATWHDIWLNEGFATYSEALWFEFETGVSNPTALHNWMESRRPGSVNGSVYCYDISDLWRIFSSDFSYDKAAWALHQLRHVVGDTVFFDILAEYRKEFAYKSATTADFQGAAETVYGKDLSWFFDEWIYDIGAPAYRYAWLEHDLGGQSYVELYVEQTQSSSYPVFAMPIDIETVSSGVPETHVVWNDAKAEHLLFAADGPVSSLDFDPDVWILRTGLSQTSFVPGPPKVVDSLPGPGGILRRPETQALTVSFHEDVQAQASDFSIVGLRTGPRSFTFSYNAGTFTATLTPDELLPFDLYTLTVKDTVTDTATGQALDGEVKNPANPEALPSGDGLPGGDCRIFFAVIPHVSGILSGTAAAGPYGTSGAPR